MAVRVLPSSSPPIFTPFHLFCHSFPPPFQWCPTVFADSSHIAAHVSLLSTHAAIYLPLSIIFDLIFFVSPLIHPSFSLSHLQSVHTHSLPVSSELPGIIYCLMANSSSHQPSGALPYLLIFIPFVLVCVLVAVCVCVRVCRTCTQQKIKCPRTSCTFELLVKWPADWEIDRLDVWRLIGRYWMICLLPAHVFVWCTHVPIRACGYTLSPTIDCNDYMSVNSASLQIFFTLGGFSRHRLSKYGENQVVAQH